MSLARLFELLEGFDARSLPLHPTLRPAELRARVCDRFDPSSPRALDALVDDAFALLSAGLTHSTHPRHFGLFNPTTHDASVAADALVARFNPQLSVRQAAPVAWEMEQRALTLLADRAGLGALTARSFTTGGAEANHTALLAALARALPTWRDDGLVGSNVRPVVYASTEAHGSIEKAVVACGLGRTALRRIPVDGACQMRVRALRECIDRDRAQGMVPLLVVGTAGTTSAGALDPLRALGEVAREHGAWFHVDAAWGGLALLSSTHRGVLDGLADADSVTWDAHKSLPVAMGAGMLFCRHGDALRAAFSVDAPYMMRDDDAHAQPYLTSLQWSRRLAGLKVLLTLATLGWDAIEAKVDGQFALADRLRAGLVARGFEVVNRTPLPVVCFRHATLRDRAVKPVLRAVWASGAAWISETRLDGRVACLRACVTNTESTADDVDALLDALSAATG